VTLGWTPSPRIRKTKSLSTDAFVESPTKSPQDRLGACGGGGGGSRMTLSPGRVRHKFTLQTQSVLNHPSGRKVRNHLLEKVEKVSWLFALYIYIIFFFFFFFLVFRDRVSLYNPGCPGAHFVDQTGLELRNPPASAS
jgi:hypothetical protein